MRALIEGSRIIDTLFGKGFKFEQMIQTMTGTLTLGADCAPLVFLDPGGAARTLNLPPESRGAFLLIVNTADAAEVLTIKEDTSTTTIGSVTQNECALCVCDGTTWRLYGLVA